MKKVKVYFWLKTAGLLSALIVLLIGTNACRERRHVTKYGPPPTDYDYDETITKYGVPVDYEEIEFIEPDSTKINENPQLD
ncbi:MAG: hypothetical protein PHH30_06425 [Bacteroidales bacterium]|nr:hypothetical protein [Bacteroidales bacterium]MDD3858972.1 hypothetical protein [Bacteroidales bacterium]